MKRYVWCEDKGAGYAFWRNVFQTIDETIMVETKESNSTLRKSVTRLTDEKNQYYILIDNAIDNPDVLREVKKITSVVKDKDNVNIIGIHSFEFALLSFEMLEQWVFAEVDELKENRAGLISAKDCLISLVKDGGDATALSELKQSIGYSDAMNSEQLAAKILFEITRNTGFETTKGNLGECFFVDCCTWQGRQDDDICGLDYSRLNSIEKTQLIIEKSVIKESLKKVGFI